MAEQVVDDDVLIERALQRVEQRRFRGWLDHAIAKRDRAEFTDGDPRHAELRLVFR